MRRTLTLLTATTLLGGVLPLTVAEAAPRSRPADVCASADRVRVPGAEDIHVACLPDLTTTGLLAERARSGDTWAYTDPAEHVLLAAAGTRRPTGVPGVQIDGQFPDTSRTNTNHQDRGWHDAQFVIRLPQRWNGGLVVTGSPGNREQYASDVVIADDVLAKGYAYASTDKGNTGTRFFTDGERPGDAMREWHARVSELAAAAQRTVQQAYGHRPRHTYMTGISNGGYLTRWQLENRPGLFDGGVDWEGPLFNADDNLL